MTVSASAASNNTQHTGVKRSGFHLRDGPPVFYKKNTYGKMQFMEEFRITVSSLKMADALQGEDVLPVFCPSRWALSLQEGDFCAKEAPDYPFGVLLNRPVFEDELEEVRAILYELEDTRLKMLYFSDPAVWQNSSPAMRKRLVYRPETLVTSINDALFWMDQGIGGVSVSPLLTKTETVRILKAVPHAEVTIHGRILCSVSRRKLLSAWKAFYHMEEDVSGSGLMIRETTRSEDMPIRERDFGTMIFSDYELESFEEIGLFQEAGCEAFYIESAGMGEEDVKEAIDIYRMKLSGKWNEEAVQRYRKNHPQLGKGYYDSETVL